MPSPPKPYPLLPPAPTSPFSLFFSFSCRTHGLGFLVPTVTGCSSQGKPRPPPAPATAAHLLDRAKPARRPGSTRRRPTPALLRGRPDSAGVCDCGDLAWAAGGGQEQQLAVSKEPAAAAAECWGRRRRSPGSGSAGQIPTAVRKERGSSAAATRVRRCSQRGSRRPEG